MGAIALLAAAWLLGKVLEEAAGIRFELEHEHLRGRGGQRANRVRRAVCSATDTSWLRLLSQACHITVSSRALVPLVYEELKKLARGRMARLASGQTLQATARVHEAWLALSGGEGTPWENRAHFFGAAARAMRNLLVHAARRKKSLKRGGDRDRQELGDLSTPAGLPVLDLLALDDALERLEREYPRQAQVVVLRYFGGLTGAEIAEAQGCGGPGCEAMRFSPDVALLGVLGDRIILIENPISSDSLDEARILNLAPAGGGQVYARGLSWFPASRFVLLSLQDPSGGDKSLWLGDVREETLTRVTASQQWETTPDVSRDGLRIAFSTTPLDWNLVQVALPGGAQRPLITSSRYDGWGDWTPDGNGLVFSTQRTGRREIWLQDLRDGTVRPIVTPDDFVDGRLRIGRRSTGAADQRRRRTRARGQPGLVSG